MKRLCILSILVIIMKASIAQFGLTTINFEDTSTLIYLSIDATTNSNNIWQIGRPNKALFSSSYSLSNAIITDTVNYYPINDTSSFTIYHLANNGFTFPHTARLHFSYKVDTDTLNDFGMIEFSPDNGMNWINLLHDSVNFPGGNYDMIFTGKTNNWQSFEMNLGLYGAIYNIQNEDTVLYRFTFVSDNVQTNKEGWIIDDIIIDDYAENIGEKVINNCILQVFPNPTWNTIKFKIDNKFIPCQIFIYDITGKLVLCCMQTDENAEINISALEAGTYQYKVKNNDNYIGSGKFIIAGK